MRFFTGLHQPADCKNFDAAFVSVNRLRTRVGGFEVGDWIMDSGAFSTVNKYGGYPSPEIEYAAQIKRWSTNGRLLAAVAQDYMCEPHVLEKTGMSVIGHQWMTIKRYDELLKCDVGGIYIMPVLQGYAPEEYVAHIRAYGARLKPGMWVGVGSVCKRNGDPSQIIAVLTAIKVERPDLRLHGFGLKTTALGDALIRELLETADSMAWSLNARMNGRNANDWREAKRWTANITMQPPQLLLDFMLPRSATIS